MKRVLKRIGQAILLAILVLVALIYAPVWDTAPPDVAARWGQARCDSAIGGAIG